MSYAIKYIVEFEKSVLENQEDGAPAALMTQHAKKPIRHKLEEYRD